MVLGGETHTLFNIKFISRDNILNDIFNGYLNYTIFILSLGNNKISIQVFKLVKIFKDYSVNVTVKFTN